MSYFHTMRYTVENNLRVLKEIILEHGGEDGVHLVHWTMKKKKKKVNKTTVPFFSQPLPAYRKRLRWGLCQRSNKHKASFSRVNISSACLSEHQGEAQFILSRRRAKNPHRSFIHPQKKENEIKKDRNRPYIPAYTNMLRFLKDVGDGRVNKLSNAS